MSAIATALKHMLAAGMPHDAIVAAVAEMEAASAPARTARQDRNRRYYERKASEKRLNASYSDVSDASDGSDAGPPALPPSPQTPQPPTHTPVDVTTRAKARPTRRCPEGWEPKPATLSKLSSEGYGSGELERAMTMMRDHEFKTARADWDATYRNWVRNKPPKAHESSDHHQRPTPREDALRNHHAGAMAALNRRVASMG